MLKAVIVNIPIDATDITTIQNIGDLDKCEQGTAAQLELATEAHVHAGKRRQSIGVAWAWCRFIDRLIVWTYSYFLEIQVRPWPARVDAGRRREVPLLALPGETGL